MRLLNQWILCIAWCLCTAQAFAAGELSRAPYLQLATPHSIYVVWRTDGAIDPVVRYGAEPDAMDVKVSGSAILLRVSSDIEAEADIPRLFLATPENQIGKDNQKQGGKKYPKWSDSDPLTNTFQYEAFITGLEPGQRYFYSVYDGDRKLFGGDPSYSFRSLQQPDDPISARIWLAGDTGTGETDQKLVYDAMLAYVAQSDRPLDHFIHLGDMAYTIGTDEQFSRNFFSVYEDLLRHTVCWPTLGNHEGKTSNGQTGVGPYFDAYVLPVAAEVGGAPSGSEAYYSFNIGRAHFVCLDSYDIDRSPEGDMARWLRADLKQADGDWLIAFWHHPPYTLGSHNSDLEIQLVEMREYIMPILEDAGVDIVFTGHSHIYERSMLMDGAYATPTTAEGVILDDGDGNPDGDGAYRKNTGLHPHEGTVQVVAGHGGAHVSRRGSMPVMREIIVENGSILLDIDGDRLVGTMIDKHGSRRDHFSIVKDHLVTPTPVDDPWQPAPFENPSKKK